MFMFLNTTIELPNDSSDTVRLGEYFDEHGMQSYHRS